MPDQAPGGGQANAGGPEAAPPRSLSGAPGSGAPGSGAAGARRRGPAKSAATKGVGAVVTVAGGLTTLLAVLNDILVPSGLLTSIVLASALLGLALTLLPKERFRKFHGGARRRLGALWGKPLRMAFAVAAGLAVVAFGVGRFAPQGGWIGASVPEIHDLQLDLGIISATTAQIADDVAEINDKLDDVKQETSTDPRKELANLGVAWTTDAFLEALRNADARTVGLFLDGGMSPAATHKGASAVVFILQPGLTTTSVPMLQLLVDKGFDLDTFLIDDYIMPDTPSSFTSLPDPFEYEDPPLQIYGGHFEGPALLWVSIMASYYGPTPHDVETLEFLLAKGADRRITLAYMQNAAVWNDTPVYFEVLEILQR